VGENRRIQFSFLSYHPSQGKCRPAGALILRGVNRCYQNAAPLGLCLIKNFMLQLPRPLGRDKRVISISMALAKLKLWLKPSFYDIILSTPYRAWQLKL